LVGFSYQGWTVSAADEGKLGVYRYNEQGKKWEYVGGKVDPAKKKVTVELAHFSKYTLMVYSKTFTDIATHWARNDLEIMAARQIATGYPDGTFRPEKQITRVEFAVLLTRVTGATYDPAKVPAFADVPANAWYAKDLAAAYAAGLVKGYSTTAFGPEDPVTREQVAAMLVRALEGAGALKPLSDEQLIAILGPFSDGTAISPWAQKATAQAVAQNIVRGYPDKTFRPQGSATRAEAIVMLKRMMDQLS
jgi:S-layer homology domain.